MSIQKTDPNFLYKIKKDPAGLGFSSISPELYPILKLALLGGKNDD